MKPPCTVVVLYLLPTLRMLIMRDLVERHGLRKIEASKRVELTPAAITQYLKGKRGMALLEEISRSDRAMAMISEMAEALAREEMHSEDLIEKICMACNEIRSKGVICQTHKKEYKTIKECRICLDRNLCEN
ncbi:MAG: hypothetical protein QXD04_04215 [Candidatus Bathyarchaeia archaeon]|nr:hypothetical protein [Candidatus Bathyarchaeota archaeon]